MLPVLICNAIKDGTYLDVLHSTLEVCMSIKYQNFTSDNFPLKHILYEMVFTFIRSSQSLSH